MENDQSGTSRLESQNNERKQIFPFWPVSLEFRKYIGHQTIRKLVSLVSYVHVRLGKD